MNVDVIIFLKKLLHFNSWATLLQHYWRLVLGCFVNTGTSINFEQFLKNKHFNHHRPFWLSGKIPNPPVSALEPHPSGRTPHPPDSLKMNAFVGHRSNWTQNKNSNSCARVLAQGKMAWERLVWSHLTFHHLRSVHCDWEPPPGPSSHRGWSRGVPSLSAVLFSKQKGSSVIETFDCPVV